MSAPDPFAEARVKGGYLGTFGSEEIPVLVRYRDVREAAADWQRFSNDAVGRVPIPAEDDVRSLRQLPIETDPPAHSGYKALVKDYFRRPQSDPAVRDAIAAVVTEALDAVLGAGPVDALQGLALPVQSRALAVLLGLPRAEAEEWIGWGLHAFKTAQGNDPARAAQLLDMIGRHTDRALAGGGEDFFGHLAQVEYHGRRLTRDEIAGFAHVTFAGGRDTLINSAAGLMAHFAAAPGDLEAVRRDPALVGPAVEEVIRHLSPLTHIGRVCTREDEVAGLPRAAGERIALCWAAANLDPEVFADANTLRIDRLRNPHVAFGSGPHNCLGSTHARQVLRSLLQQLARRVARIDPVEVVRGRRSIGGVVRPHGFERLVLTFHPF